MSKVKVTRPLNVMTENQLYPQECSRTLNLVYRWCTPTMSRITGIRGDLQAESFGAVQATTCVGGRDILCRPQYRLRSWFRCGLDSSWSNCGMYKFCVCALL